MDKRTKAGPALDPTQTTTELASVPDPAKVTPQKIDEIAGEHGDKEDPSQGANADVAETLKDNKATAKSSDEPERGYFHGQGGAVGI